MRRQSSAIRVNQPAPPDVHSASIVQTANLYLLARRLFLASIGAMALTAEEAIALLERLVERGEIAEADMQRLVREVRTQGQQTVESSGKSAESALKKVETALEESVETILTKLDVPSKRDIDELSRKIGDLNSKVTTLTAHDSTPSRA